MKNIIEWLTSYDYFNMSEKSRRWIINKALNDFADLCRTTTSGTTLWLTPKEREL